MKIMKRVKMILATPMCVIYAAVVIMFNVFNVPAKLLKILKNSIKNNMLNF